MIHHLSYKKLGMGRYRICFKCHQKKPLEAFIKIKNRPYGRGYLCSECSNKKGKEWRKTERGSEYMKEYKIKNGSKPLRMRWNVLKRDDFTCQYCGRKAPNVELEVDHIVPGSKGGKYIENNLITSCFDCNRGKGNLFL